MRPARNTIPPSLKPVAKVHLFFDASGFKRALFVEQGELPQLRLQLVPGLHVSAVV
jgi:hypothetical protein